MNNFFENIAKKSAKVEGPEFIVMKRHWGFSIVLDANTRLHSMEGEPSAHFHRYRTEDYVLYSGKMTVYRGQYIDNDLQKTMRHMEAIELNPGDRVIMSPRTVHIPINTGNEPAVFIEISHGPYEEADIERVYDKNGRDVALAEKWAKLGYEAGISVKELIPMIKNKLSK